LWESILATLAVVSVVLLGTLLRLHGLAEHSLWLDEGVSIWEAKKPLPDLVLFLARRDFHPPLYFGLLHFAMLLDDSVYGIRLVSVIPSVLTMPVLYGLGRRLHSHSVGLLAALLLAISPFNIYYAQEARNYALFGLMATVASYCLVWGLQSSRKVAWTWYGVAAAATVYSNTVAIFVILTHALILVIALLSGKQARATGVWALIGGLLVWTPWAVVAGLLRWIPRLTLTSTSTSQGNGGGGLSWIRAATPNDLYTLVLSFTSYLLPEHINFLGESSLLDYIAPIIVLVFLGIVLLGIVSWNNRTRRMSIAAFLLISPVVLELCASINNSLFIDRTLVPESIIYCLLIAAGVAWLVKQPLGKLIALLVFADLLLLNTASLLNYYNYYEKERWDSAATLVAREGRPGDAILLYRNSSQFPFDYYYARTSARKLPQIGVPCDAYTCARWDSHARANDQARIAAEVSRYQRMWIVKRAWGNENFHPADAVGEDFAKRIRKVGNQDFYGVTVTLYQVEGTPEAGGLRPPSIP
jgi:uncharacterized membrane protein